MDRGGGGGSENGYMLTKAQASDPIAYHKAKEAAAKAGAEIVFVRIEARNASTRERA
jgi:hypothetical protein